MKLRTLEIWKKVEVLEFKSKTQQLKKKNELKNVLDQENYKIKLKDIKLEELDEDLTGVEKQVFKYKEEQPKLTKEERLERFKNK